MNADSNMWISRRQAVVWCAAVVVVVLLAMGYYFGRGSSGAQGWTAEDSALIEESRLDIAADTAVVKAMTGSRRKPMEVKLSKRKDRNPGPVSRDFLGEEVKRE